MRRVPTPTQVAASATVVAALVRRVRDGRVGPVEERVFRAVNDLPGALYAPIWPVMQSGSLVAVAVAAAAVRRAGRSDLALPVAAGGAATWVLAKAVKRSAGRGRPADHLAAVNVRGRPQHGLGYPSGHAAVSLALAALGSPSGAPWAWWAVAAIAGFGRMYVGAHLPLDVVGGVALGSAVAGATPGLQRVLSRSFTQSRPVNIVSNPMAV